MPRVKRGVRGARRRKDVMKKASGYRGGRSKLMRTAMEAVDKAEQHAYKHRRTKKREFRKLWSVRIGIASKQEGMSYSKFMGALKKANIELDRKILADLAVHNPSDFAAIVHEAKSIAA